MTTDQTAAHAPRSRVARGLASTGLAATLVAVGAVTAAAALALAAGVDFEVPDGGESIPLSGFAVVTGVFAGVGVALALALQRWSTRPATRFVWTAVPLTAVSLVPPLIVGANVPTAGSLLVLHLLAAAVVIPVLAGRLRR